MQYDYSIIAVDLLIMMNLKRLYTYISIKQLFI